MQQEHRDYLCFLWKEPDADGEPQVYRFTTLIFGATDSPFQANTCLRKLVSGTLAKPDVTELERRACRVITQDTYVDDITMGGNSADKVYKVMNAVKALLEPAHFYVRKWKTNSPELLGRIPESERAPTVEGDSTHLLEWDDPYPPISEESKMLGVGWDPRPDTIRFQYEHLPELNDNSKTAVASLLAKIYDPLGLVSPYVLKARYVLKCAHLSKIGWKDHLPEELIPMWHAWVAQIPDLSALDIPRLITLSTTTELHVFADASNMGYGYAAYLRNPTQPGIWRSHLLMSRSRIAPVKELTVPKLELVAAEMAAKAAIEIAQTLDINKKMIQCWTDSEIVLHWLTKAPHTLIPFMANRIRRIQQYGVTFLHVATRDNPADIVSRGCDASELKKSLWMMGPSLLEKDRACWPTQKSSWGETTERNLGVKKQYVFNFSTLTMCIRGPTGLGEVLLEEYHSTYHRLISHTANILHKFHIWKTRALKSASLGDVDWFKEAQTWWFREIQTEEYSVEINGLKEELGLPAGSPIYPLTPFLDSEGLLRVGGRLAKAEIPWEEKHPIILGKGHRVVTLLIQEAHQVNFHAGTDWLHHHLRQNYWIPGSRVAIKSAT